MVLLFAALLLAFEIEGTDQAVRESAHGGAVAALAPSVLNAVLATGVLVLI